MPSFDPISLETFRERTGISREELAPGWGDARRIIALRDIVVIESVQAMRKEYLHKLIANVGLVADPAEKPYRGCDVSPMLMDPSELLVAQTFVERPKCQRILEDVSGLFEAFCMTRGVAKLTAHVVLGRDAAGELAIAHYLPPIVEESAAGRVLLDGTHRSFLVMAVGTTIETILVRGVTAPFPCEPQEWSAVRKVDVKPPRNERFVDLREGFFRDVKNIGIDG